MSTGAILTGLALLVITMPYVFSPFLPDRRRKSKPASPQHEDIEERKKGALLALGDLDFDYRTGKVAQEDYELLRLQLVAEAGSLIETARQEKDEIEKLIDAHRETYRGETCAHCGRRVQAHDLFCPGCGTALGKPCPQCGKKVGLSDRFCPGCGTKF